MTLAADIAAIREATGCTPDFAELRLHDLRFERALDALHRPRCPVPPTWVGGGDFIDFTREEDPDVND